MIAKPIRLSLPAVALLALSACAGQQSDEVALATTQDLNTISQRVTNLETQVQQTQASALQAQQSAERAEASADRVETLFREGQRK